jgi:hypothetical protein
LNTHEFKLSGGLALNLKTKLNRLSNPLHQHVERFSLGVTPVQLGNRRDVEAFFIALDHDIKTAPHAYSHKFVRDLWRELQLAASASDDVLARLHPADIG